MKKFIPILSWLPKYKKAYLSGDIAAGLTVGIMLVPQGMAYAMIAGLPPVFGLYAALVPQIFYTLLGTSRRLAVGPVAMDSLLVASGLGALSISGIEEYIGMAIFLALFMGVIQFFFGILRMGFLVNFLSAPVISGFTSAAAIIIAMSQLKHLLGAEIAQSNKMHELLLNTWDKLDEISPLTLLMGVVAIAIMLVLKKISRKIPGALIVVVLGILGVFFMGLQDQGIAIVGAVPEGLPGFAIPEIPTDRIQELWPIALTLALIAFLEAISVAKAVEEKHEEHEVDPNQELIALGISNIAGSFFQSYPVTGGFSRTAVNDETGAKTGITSLISSLVVGLTLIFLTPLFYYLPNAVLAAIIMVAVFGLINLKFPAELFRNRKDEFALLVFTFLLTLFVGIREGILFGVLFSLLLLVYRTSKPHFAVLGKVAGTHYFKNIGRFPEVAEEAPHILIVRLDSQLYFGNKDFFREQLETQIQRKGDTLSVVILNAEAINYIDSSGVIMLRLVVRELRARNIKFLVAGAIGPTRDILFNSGLAEEIGPENLYVRTDEAYDSCCQERTRSAAEQQITSQSR